jgi:hypothetical protein
MARFKLSSVADVKVPSRSGGGAFTPTHKFEANETKYLQFLPLPGEDEVQVAEVLMHRFVIIGEREDGSDKYADFIVGKDDETDEYSYDPLKDRFGLKPVVRNIAVAVELEPVYTKEGSKRVLDGWNVVTRQYEKDDETIEVPNVALVNESPYTFYSHLIAYADLEPIGDVVFAVKRTGKSTDTSYTLMKAGPAVPNLSEEDDIAEFFEAFDFVEYLENLADEDRMHDLIDDLPDDFVVTRYPPKGKAKKEKAKPAASTRSRRKAADADEAADEPEADAGETKPAAARRSRFSDLRQSMGADDE